MHPPSLATTLAAAIALSHAGCESLSGSVPAASTPIAKHASDVETGRSERAHFGAATDLQLAIVHGRLTDARDLAGWIVTHAEPRSDALISTARQITTAADVPTAAAMTAQLAGACGRCHEVREVFPAMEIPPLPPEHRNLEEQMHRHEWAAARLWNGVVGPDDASWQAGARALTTVIDVGATTHDKPNVEVVGYADAMHGFARRAEHVKGAGARTPLFAEILQTCASCHAIVRPRAIARRD